ncbi:EAL domain-containing protein [Glaciecola sp. KUL10]|uniref:EAL domain-containing protein n=1 Tax=Glaciecola sp. (strain KUL10) TaxID=2161813 RepID=UPI000D78A42E|nr:EAL domain-containing protein [Glaciecola sp. KUL10]GBL06006.1 diguanylate cyclase/phosphodiesterase [Glaciecola sp. KUL10]
MFGIRGLLSKWAIILGLLACTSLTLAYFVVDAKHQEELDNALIKIKQNHHTSVNNVLRQRLDQLTLVAEEIYMLSNLQQEQIANMRPILANLWPKLELTFELSTMALTQDSEMVKFGSLSDDLIQSLHNKTLVTLRPQSKFVCRPICSIVSVIPVFLNSQQASLLIAADFSATIMAMHSINSTDIATLVNASGIDGSQPSIQFNNIAYTTDIITNADVSAKIIKSLVSDNSNFDAFVDGRFVSTNGTTYFVWIRTLSNSTDMLPMLMIKDVGDLLAQKSEQKQSLLVIIALIQLGIFLIVSAVSYRPIARLTRLRRTIGYIGEKQYEKAIKTLGVVHQGKSSDEIQALEREFNKSIYQLMEYEEELNSSRERLTKMATIDVTTQLLNRNAFLENMLALENKLAENRTTLIFMDLDGFKSVNDNLGHVIGDLLLEKVGARLLKLSTETLKVYRIGGDEFLVCVEAVPKDFNLRALCQSLLHLFDDSFAIDRHSISVSASIGVATATGDIVSYIELLKQADIAMYQAKAEGKNRYCQFTTAMMEQINLRYTIKSEFYSALKDGQLSLVYQPIVDTNSGKLIKLEALSRWMHPTLGFIRPDIFIEVIEETTFIESLSEWLIENAAIKVRELDALGLNDVVVSINISGAQVTNIKSIEQLKTLCEMHCVAYERIELEITETSLIEDFKKAKAWIQEVCNLGFGIAIDDFGTGYSSLSYLTAFPFDCVKLDRSLLLDVEENERSRNIVKSVTTMIHSMGVPVVAEGIETASHLQVIKTLGCDYVQGYYFSRPLADKDLQTLLDKYIDQGQWLAA